MIDPAQYPRISTLFDQLCPLSPAERSRALERLTETEDPSVLEAVRRLLTADEQTFSELDAVLPDDDRCDARVHDQDSLPESIGGFRVLRKIGQGGMGIVYEAEQVQPHRRVALKVIATARPSSSLQRRFFQEVDALGRLSHDGIARIYGAGTDPSLGHLPWFAMELVDGVPIDTHCESRGLDHRERLELLARVCDAVEHAHQRGIIHRDLKPANILVPPGGHPKVLDFGVALLSGGDEPSTRVTSQGQVLGTLAYMSPEQAAGRPETVTSQADVYSLGAVAYELLTGHLPVDVAGLSLPEACKRLQDTEPRPLGRWDPKLRGDVETLVSRALEHDPERRFPRVADLAADIRRYLRDEPIQSRPPSALYLGKKFARRHRGLVVAGAFTLLALVAGTIVSVLFAVEAGKARTLAEEASADSLKQARRAQLEAETAQEFIDFLFRTLSGLDPNVTGTEEPTLRMAMDVVAADLPHLKAPSIVRARLHAFLGNMYRALGTLPAAESHFDAAVDLFGQEKAPSTTAAEALRDAAWFHVRAARLDRALELAEESVRMFRALNALATPAGAASLSTLADVHLAKAEHPKAQTLLREALDLQRAVFPGDHEDIAITLQSLADVRGAQQNWADAEALLNESLDMRRRLYGNHHALVGESLQNLSLLFFQQGNLDRAGDLQEQAMAIREKSLPVGHPALASGYFNLAILNLKRGEPQKANAWLDRAEALWREALGDSHPRMANLETWRAQILLALGDRPGAIQHAKNAVRILEPLGEQDPETLDVARGLLVAYLWNAGEHDEAAAFIQRAWGESVAQGTETQVSNRLWVGEAAILQSAWPEASDILTALEADLRNPGDREERVYRQRTLVALGKTRLGQGRDSEAIPLLIEARDIAIGDNNRVAAESCGSTVIELLRKLGRDEEAETLKQRWESEQR